MLVDGMTTPVTGRNEVTGMDVVTGAATAAERNASRLAAHVSSSLPGYQPLICAGVVGTTTG
jgi:hypothetical protein